MTKIIQQPTVTIFHLTGSTHPGAATASRVVIETTPSGQLTAYAVISPVDLGQFATEAEAARAVQSAMCQLFQALEAEYPVADPNATPLAPPSDDAMATARVMAGAPFAPPMTEADIVALAYTLDGKPSTSPNVVPGGAVLDAAPVAAPAVSSVDVATGTSVVAAGTRYPTVPTDARPVLVVLDTGHAPAPAPAAVSPLGHAVDIVEVKAT